MRKEKTHYEKTAAETKSIGFDYQYYFFLWKLLSLRTGESVGLEVKDDVHTELDNDEHVLYQIKHTIKTKNGGSTVNLTASDIDLWKTLSNWAQVVSDDNDNRSNKHEQLHFIKKTSFVLASNKSSAGNNRVLKSILYLQENANSITETKKVFQELANSSNNDTLIGYIHDVLGLDEKILEEFLLKVFFELDEDDIIKKCKDAIKADKIDVNKIDDVFASVDSAIRADNFIKIKRGGKIQITFDAFYLKYRRHYDLSRNGSLSIKEFKGSLPKTLESQTFIKQLIEIEDIQSDDFENIAEFTRFKLMLQNNIIIWLRNGEITQEEISRFKKDAIDQWGNKHRSAFRRVTDEYEYNVIGLKVLDYMREGKLSISGQVLDTDMSNGTFYDLSDVPVIGWRKDWEKYKI
jgi:hypothetical protein